MDERAETVELAITPIPPDTASATKDELLAYVEQTLRDAGHADLLAAGQLQVEVERTFPTDAAVLLGITVLSRMAEETFRQVVLPALKRRYGVEERPARGKRRKPRKQDR